eukprot:TRINITY_DN10651_c0_g1_i1.p1 TRINITY_DN10651_c0_g1~~TRINITY_DN10651_c0_g1_i1.p1  ORF type:complete len:772 (-),score=76.27 TRINITY_DN10651_c0_g1_i1:424-2739(-)
MDKHLIDPKTEVAQVGDYILEGTLGRGTYAVVKLGRHQHTHERVAVKIMKAPPPDKHGERNGPNVRIDREISIMQYIKHPCVTRLIETHKIGKNIYIVMEYLDGGTLWTYLRSYPKGLPKPKAFKFLYQLVSGMHYCHCCGICHRDIKPENILLDHAENIHIADFGMANLVNHGKLLETACGSPHYAAPEIVKGEKYDGVKSDSWSLGIVAFGMFAGRLPFNDPDIPTLLCKVVSGRFKMPSSFDAGLQDIMNNILTKAESRFTCEDIMKHPWWIAQCQMQGLDPRGARTHRKISVQGKMPTTVPVSAVVGQFSEDPQNQSPNARALDPSKKRKELAPVSSNRARSPNPTTTTSAVNNNTTQQGGGGGGGAAGGTQPTTHQHHTNTTASTIAHIDDAEDIETITPEDGVVTGGRGSRSPRDRGGAGPGALSAVNTQWDTQLLNEDLNEINDPDKLKQVAIKIQAMAGELMRSYLVLQDACRAMEQASVDDPIPAEEMQTACVEPFDQEVIACISAIHGCDAGHIIPLLTTTGPIPEKAFYKLLVRHKEVHGVLPKTNGLLVPYKSVDGSAVNPRAPLSSRPSSARSTPRDRYATTRGGDEQQQDDAHAAGRPPSRQSSSDSAHMNLPPHPNSTQQQPPGGGQPGYNGPTRRTDLSVRHSNNGSDGGEQQQVQQQQQQGQETLTRNSTAPDMFASEGFDALGDINPAMAQNLASKNQKPKSKLVSKLHGIFNTRDAMGSTAPQGGPPTAGGGDPLNNKNKKRSSNRLSASVM